jgi:predicted aminopeptidase
MSRPAPEARAARTRVALLAATLSFLVGCGGCSPTYILRSGFEEARILLARQSIDALLERPELDADTRAKLELVMAVRRFAADSLGLDVGEAYASYSIVPPGALLQVVSAAERTRLVPYTWWFPIVGDVDYKGYFELPDAEAEAKRLQGEGYDTYVRPSIAFSTLGWFDDPVLSSWLRSDPVRIAELLIHELLHRTWYVSGETAFNESLASFVGHVGAIEFFRAHDGPDAPTTRRAEQAWQDALRDARLWATAVAELKVLYATATRDGRPLDEVLAEREVVFARLRTNAAAAAAAAAATAPPAQLPTPTPAPTPGEGGASPAPSPTRRPVTLNNAVILANYAYMRDLSAFDRIHAATGDLRATIARLRAITEDAKDPFAAVSDAADALPAPTPLP